mmetsp:Transcript_41065/g.64130  ORF Transcript_41065/g.64130 Transcript_41065/m.64130 type:complete len:246 (+) Transcript_41065:773-1510(+)
MKDQKWPEGFGVWLSMLIGSRFHRIVSYQQDFSTLTGSRQFSLAPRHTRNPQSPRLKGRCKWTPKQVQTEIFTFVPLTDPATQTSPAPWLLFHTSAASQACPRLVYLGLGAIVWPLNLNQVLLCLSAANGDQAADLILNVIRHALPPVLAATGTTDSEDLADRNRAASLAIVLGVLNSADFAGEGGVARSLELVQFPDLEDTVPHSCEVRHCSLESLRVNAAEILLVRNHPAGLGSDCYHDLSAH